MSEKEHETTHGVTDSDPSGNSPHGLSGDLGISSERTGEMHRTGEVGTHAAGRPQAEFSEDPAEDAPREQ